MKAIALHEYGGFDALRFEEVPTPEPGLGEVLVRVHAAGVNHCDTDVRRGVFGVLQRFPHVMGVDAAGVVESVGPGVTAFKPGDRVAPHFMLSCGSCRNCRRGVAVLCDAR
jgi:NADPH:quinone reductase-like Zn-dependent oxidoreductase